MNGGKEFRPSAVGVGVGVTNCATGFASHTALLLRPALHQLILIPAPICEPISGIVIIGIELPWGGVELVDCHPKVITFLGQVFTQVGIHCNV